MRRRSNFLLVLLAAAAVLAAAAPAAVAAPGTVGTVGIGSALLAGLLSFLSPCVLPLLPSYLALLAGVRGIDEHTSRSRTFVHALAFVIGFSAVFVLLGLSATAIGGTLRQHSDDLARAGGVLMIAFGVVVSGLVPVRWLQRDVRLLDKARGLRRLGPAGSMLIGIAFGAGWTPCIGPVLAGILTLAAASGETGAGVVLLGAYSAGLAIPFLAAAALVGRIDVAGPRSKRLMPWINRVTGALLVVLGVLLVTGAMTRLSTWFARFTPAWLG